MLLLHLLIPILTIIFLLYLKKCWNDRPKNFPPGPPKLPIWGSYWFILKENFKILHLATEMLGKKYKTDIVGLFLGDLPTIVTLNYDLTKELLVRDEFIGRTYTILGQTRSQGDDMKGIIFADGPIWKSLRRFSLRSLRDHGFGRRSETVESFIQEDIRFLIDFVNSEPAKPDLDVCRRRGEVLAPDFMYSSIMNSIMMTLTTTRFDHQKVKSIAKLAFRFLQSSDATGGALVITPWVRYIAPEYFGYKSVHDDNRSLVNFMKEIIDEHLKTYDEDHHRDFIDDFISESRKQGTELDYLQLALTLLDYMGPAPVSVGHTISFILALLINHPEIQSKIHKELDTVVGNSRLPTIDDRPNLHYLDATIREVLRLMPVTPSGVTRRALVDTTLGGYSIPKDAALIPNFWTAHRDEKYFPNPNQFNPERFLDDEGKLIKKELILGFGAGKRLCAGETFAKQILFLYTAGLLQNFSLKSANGKPINTLNVKSGNTLALKDPLWIVMTPR